MSTATIAAGAGVATTARLPFTVGGLGACVPAGRLTNRDLAVQVDTSDEWIVERTGISERRVVAGSQSTSDLAIVAVQSALADARLGVSDLAALVVCTTTGDHIVPSTSAIVAGALGFHGAAMDINAACSGWVYGLVTASSLMAAMGRPVAVVGAEVLSKIVDPLDRGTLPLFGDGAAAAVLLPGGAGDGGSAGGGGGAPGLVSWDLGVDGTAASLLMVPGGGTRQPLTASAIAAGDQYLKMDGREVFRRAVRAVEASCRQTLASAGVAPDQVGLFVPHQANARIVDAILPRLGIPSERTMMNIDRYGNTSAASVPLALCEAAASGRAGAGDLVLVAGFGAGMTWATALLRWDYAGDGPSEPCVLGAFA